MVATLPQSPDMQMASYLAFAGQAAEHMNSDHALTANEALVSLTRAPSQAQEKSMESALEQAASSIDFSSLNISLENTETTEVRMASAVNNPEHAPDGNQRS